MEKFSNLMVVLSGMAIGKFINVYGATGNVKHLKIPLSSTGETELMSLLDEYGKEGWEVVNFSTNASATLIPPYGFRVFLKKRVE